MRAPRIPGMRTTLYLLGNDRYWHDHEGNFHRSDGPAAEFPDGTKCWFVHGERHRADGPAIEWADGRKDWWDHGSHIREDP